MPTRTNQLKAELDLFKATLKHYDDIEYGLAKDLDDNRRSRDQCIRDIDRLEAEMRIAQEKERIHKHRNKAISPVDGIADSTKTLFCP